MHDLKASHKPIKINIVIHIKNFINLQRYVLYFLLHSYTKSIENASV